MATTKQTTTSAHIADIGLTITPAALKHMTIYAIARLIRHDWKNPYFGAVPYIDAMATMTNISDKYGEDSGASIIAYGLSNMSTWKGPAARLIKMELRKRLDESYK
jgi:hypothetical protein